MKKRIAIFSLLLCVFTLWLAFVIALWNGDMAYYLPYTVDVSYITGLSNKNYIISAGLPLLAFALLVAMPGALGRIFPGYRVWNGWYITAVTVILSAEILCMLSGAEFFAGLFGDKAVLKKLSELYIHSCALGLGLSVLSFLAGAAATLLRAGGRKAAAILLCCLASLALCGVISVATSVASQMVLNILSIWASGAAAWVSTLDNMNAANLKFALVSLISAPIMEETAFRGLICRGMDKCGRRWAAILISAVFFGLWHRNLGQFAYTFVWGVMYGWLYLNTGSVVWTTLIHFGSNLIAILSASTKAEMVLGAHPWLVSARGWLAELPTAASLLVMALCAAVIVLCLRGMKRQGDKIKSL